MLLELGNLTFDWEYRLHRHLRYSIANILMFLYSNRTVLVVSQ